MAIQGAAPDAGPLGDQLKRGVEAVFRQHLARGLQQGGAIVDGVFSGGARHSVQLNGQPCPFCKGSGQRLFQHHEFELRTGRIDGEGTPFAGGGVAAPLVPGDQLGAAVDDGHLHAAGGEAGDGFLLGGGEDAAAQYAWADTLVVALRPDWPSFRHTVPSKTYEVLAVGRHVTGMVTGEAARTLDGATVTRLPYGAGLTLITKL